MAYSNMAQLRMLASDQPGASEWGGRAIELAERLGETEIVVHALNNVGAAELERGMPGGAAKLERSLELALEAGLEEHVARAYTNLGAGAVAVGDYARGEPNLDAGIAYCAEHDLDSWLVYMTGWRARAELDQGRWDAAAASASAVAEPRRRRDAEPHHAARGPGLPAGAPRRPRHVGAARRGARAGARGPARCSAWRSWRAPAPRRAGSPARARRSRPRPTWRSRSPSSTGTRG